MNAPKCKICKQHNGAVDKDGVCINPSCKKAMAQALAWAKGVVKRVYNHYPANHQFV